ncbi:MAG: polyphosphate polymerase domain-containing protein [Deltaproteobacteria bacterium]|nr:polyphosphate polymerase domain-containing protein [Deltaproteobacteria bacterium]
MITPASLQRREYKYLVDEDLVERIRRHIAGVCAVDAHAAPTGGRYRIDTLYLDTPRLDSYRATVEDAGDRYKLRVRGYPSAPESPVFFEVKRRAGETIHKTRAAYRGDWARLLDAPEPALFDALSPRVRAGIDNFICHYHRAPFRPVALVRYEREPYFSLVDDYARVTFDREVSYQPAHELSLAGDAAWSCIDDAVSQCGPRGSLVLLELKFTTLVPSWMRRMVHTLELQRMSFCKYTRSIDAMRAPPLSQRIARAGLSR